MILPIYNFDVFFPFDNVFFLTYTLVVPRLERQRLSYNLTTVLNFLFHYVGAKLSIFLSWYQIVRLPSWAKLSVFTILVSNCPVPNCLGAKWSYHLKMAMVRMMTEVKELR